MIIAKKKTTTTTQSYMLAFVDCKKNKAFDTVWRPAILHRLLDEGIGGNFYIRIIEHVYSSTVCAVQQSNVHSDVFATNREDCLRSRELKIAFTTYIFRG